MTGFGSAEGNVRDGRVRVEIRTVNHRFFNPQLKLPSDLLGIEAELRERLRAVLGRGHVTVTVRWVERPSTHPILTVDLERARAVLGALRELKRALRLKGDVDLAFVARQPDILLAREADEVPLVWGDLEPAVAAATAEVVAMREREGAALAHDLSERLSELDRLSAYVARRAPERLEAERERLRRTVADLMAAAPLDEQRLVTEVALLADRMDVTEELVRLRTHLAACRDALRSQEPVGKRLGFLAQELLRETNTIGAKANDVEITHAVIAMKGELEKLREQLENLE